MFTDTELKRIRYFLKAYKNLGKVSENLKERLWYATHGTNSPTKRNQILRRYRKVANNQTKVYKKSVEYTNALKRKYGLRIHSGTTRPNLPALGWAMRHHVTRRTAERTMRTAPLAPNMVREIIRTANPSPPRARTAVYPTGGFASSRRLQTPRYIHHEPW